jgi:hypothetical protein
VTNPPHPNRFLGGLLAVVALVALSSCGTTPATETTASTDGAAAAAPTTEAPLEPGSTKDNPAPIGTEVAAAQGWMIKVVSADLNANAALAKANQFNKPQTPGNQFVAVTITVHNGDTKPGAAMTNINVGLLSPAGVKLTQTFASTPTMFDITAQLQPGGTLTGQLIYEAPPADVPQLVMLVEPFFTLDKTEDQRFLAIQ